jgi:hypothetical protein
MEIPSPLLFVPPIEEIERVYTCLDGFSTAPCASRNSPTVK